MPSFVKRFACANTWCNWRINSSREEVSFSFSSFFSGCLQCVISVQVDSPVPICIFNRGFGVVCKELTSPEVGNFWSELGWRWYDAWLPLAMRFLCSFLLFILRCSSWLAHLPLCVGLGVERVDMYARVGFARSWCPNGLLEKGGWSCN